MALRLSHVSVDARDAYAQSRWWAEVLGWSEDPEDPNLPGHEECMIFSLDGRRRLLFIEVPEARTVKNRLHLDLAPTDASRESASPRSSGCRPWARPGSPTTVAPTGAAGSRWPTPRATSSACSPATSTGPTRTRTCCAEARSAEPLDPPDDLAFPPWR